MRLLLVPLMVLALVAGCSGGSDGSAGPTASAEGPDDMLKRVLGRHFKGQYRLAYDDLHPAHQALVSRDNYAYCLSRVLTKANLRTVTTLKIADTPLAREGIPEKQAKEVTLRVTAAFGNMRDSAAQSFRAVRIGGRWAWILPATDIPAYRAGRCPAS